MSNTTTDPYASLKEKMAHMQAVIDGTYKPEFTQGKIEEIEQSIRTLCNDLLTHMATLFNHFRLSDVPMPKLDLEIDDSELKVVLDKAFQAFPQGANGQQLADFIGDYRVTSKRITSYQEETFLLVRDGTGLNTNFRPATAAETDAMKAAVIAKEVAAKQAEESAARAAAPVTSAKRSSGKRK